jgi:hypothetical protein
VGYWYNCYEIKPEPLPSAPSYTGHVQEGIIVLDAHVSLGEGQPVRVQPLTNEVIEQEKKARLEQLKHLFNLWTEEDSTLSDEEADRLGIALDKNRGLRFRRIPSSGTLSS